MAIAAISTAAAAQDREWTSASKPGDGSIFTFRGHRIGDALEAHLNDYGKGVLGGSPCTRLDGFPGMQFCSDYSLPQDGTKSFRKLAENIWVHRVSYSYLDGRLTGFNIVTHVNQFGPLKTALKARYGEPHSAKTETIQNRAGASFSNEVLVWNTPHGQMTLSERKGRVDESQLKLMDAAGLAEMSKRRNAAIREQGKKAF